MHCYPPSYQVRTMTLSLQYSHCQYKEPVANLQSCYTIDFNRISLNDKITELFKYYNFNYGDR